MVRNQPPRLGVLVSGGLDSAVLVGRLLRDGNRLLPIYVHCGFRWEPAERYWLGRFLQTLPASRVSPLRLIAMPMRSLYGTHWGFAGPVPSGRSADQAVFLPGRNALLLTAAAIVCAQQRIATIALGTLRGNPFGDATPRFFNRLATCLSQALSRPVRAITPLRHLRKPQVIRQAVDLPLELTFSCLRPVGRRHCGRCNKCAERRRAFRAARLPDPTDYDKP